jgi:hypothetical protein
MRIFIDFSCGETGTKKRRLVHSTSEARLFQYLVIFLTSIIKKLVHEGVPCDLVFVQLAAIDTHCGDIAFEKAFFASQ